MMSLAAVDVASALVGAPLQGGEAHSGRVSARDRVPDVTLRPRWGDKPPSMGEESAAADCGLADWLEHIADVETFPPKTVSDSSAQRPPRDDAGGGRAMILRAINPQLRGGGIIGREHKARGYQPPRGGSEQGLINAPKTSSPPTGDTSQCQREHTGACCSGDSSHASSSAPAIDLASIRAVYKEEVASTTALDGLLASSGAPSRIDREALGAGLDGFVLKDVLAPGECKALIKATEGMGFSFWNPESQRKDYRNADTVEVTHQELADALWLRVKDHVVPEVTIVPDSPRYSKELEGKWVAVGMNSNMLFNRYLSGGHFSPHTDGYTVMDFNTRSMYSALVYLNDCPVGGATRMMEESGDALKDHVQEEFVLDEAGRHRFRDSRIRSSISPRAGHALFFFQDTLHEGEPVGEGHCKYIIRSDVIYERSPRILDTPQDKEAYRLFREAELAEADNPEEALRLFKKCARTSPALAEVYGL